MNTFHGSVSFHIKGKDDKMTPDEKNALLKDLYSWKKEKKDVGGKNI